MVNPARRLFGRLPSRAKHSGGLHARRRKQSYLLNPANPMETVHFPARDSRMFRVGTTGVFGRKKKTAMKKKSHHKKSHKKSLIKRLASKLVRKLHRKHAKRVVHHKRKHPVKISRKVHKAKRKAARKAVKKTSHNPRRMARRIKRMIRRNPMAKRRHHRHVRRNPLAGLSRMTKGFVNTNLLMDGSLVAGGMIASKFAVDFAAAKIAFVATPVGRIVTRVVLGSAVLFGGKKWAKYTEPLALGFIAPAAVDLITMLVPAGLLPAGGVQMLQAGYLPDVPRSQVSLEQGYMPDVAEQSFGFSE